MAGSRKTRAEAAARAAASAQAIRDSALRIWLAGLGAFEHARTEGPRVFDALVAQGRTLGARAAGAADEALRSLLELNENLREMAERGKKRSAATRGRKARPAARKRKAGAARKAGAGSAAKKRKASGTRRKARA
jgi:hypothetical protein